MFWTLRYAVPGHSPGRRSCPVRLIREVRRQGRDRALRSSDPRPGRRTPTANGGTAPTRAAPSPIIRGPPTPLRDHVAVAGRRTVLHQGPRRLDLLADTRTRKHNIAADAFVDARATRPPGDPGQAKLGPNERLPCASAELFKRVSAAPARAKPNTKRPLDGQPSQPSQRGRGLRGEGRGRPWDHPNQAPHTHCS